MSTRHTQSRRTHCQRTGTITWQSEYICPGTRGSEAALPSVLLTGPQLSSLSALSPHCLSPGGGRNYLLNRQKPLLPCVAPPASLSPSRPRPVASLSTLTLTTHIHTHIPTATAPPIHGFVTILIVILMTKMIICKHCVCVCVCALGSPGSGVIRTHAGPSFPRLHEKMIQLCKVVRKIWVRDY